MTLTIPVQAPNGLDEILAHYGDPHLQLVDGAWTVDSQWESANMTMIAHPLFPSGKLYVHRLVAAPMLRVFDRWRMRIAAGDPYRVRMLGCFAPRAQRGSFSLIPSTHSWGIAFDVNADANPLIAPCLPEDPRRKTAKDIPGEWINDAKLEGWFWGGEFRTRFDAMHFQLCSGF